MNFMRIEYTTLKLKVKQASSDQISESNSREEE